MHAVWERAIYYNSHRDFKLFKSPPPLSYTVTMDFLHSLEEGKKVRFGVSKRLCAFHNSEYRADRMKQPCEAGDYFDIVASLPFHAFRKYAGIHPSLNWLTRSLLNPAYTENNDVSF